MGLVAMCPTLVGLPLPSLVRGVFQQASDDLETLRQKAETQLSSAQGSKADIRLMFRNGEFLDGELVTETVDGVTMRVAGIETRFPQSRIDRLIRLPDLATRYRNWRSEIDDGDVGHIEQLIQWLAAQELYHVALYEAVKLKQHRPRDPRVAALERRMRGQVQLFDQRGQGVARAPTPNEKPMPLLTPEQVNLIKVYEIDMIDQPRVRIAPRDIQDFLLAFRDDPRVPQTPEGRQAMISGDPLDVLRLMFQLKARDYYSKVRVLDDPDVLKRFRRDVTDWLVVGCATTQCHGGVEAGSLRLENRNARGETQAYTNFLILTRATMKDGTPLINLEDPDESPLLHLGLGRVGSRFPHPEVPVDRGNGDAWKEVFPRVDDRRWNATTAWIRSLYQPRPEYPIEYPPVEEGAEPVEVEEPASTEPHPDVPFAEPEPAPGGGDGPR